MEHTTKRTIFPKDTLALKSRPDIIGTATITWHDYDDALYEETDDVVPGEGVTAEAIDSFVLTGGQPPLYHLVFLPALPSYPLYLVRESDVILLDRAFVFGDVVKRSATDAISGTVINVGVNVDLVHSGLDLAMGFPVMAEGYQVAMANGYRTAKDVPDDELEMATDWEEGGFVIWKNCWLGMVEGIEETVAIRLSNGSVVIPEDCFSLEIPVALEDMPDNQNTQNSPSIGGGNRPRNATNRLRQGTQPEPVPGKISSVPAPENLTVGQQVMTKKANLRRGKWIYGQYDPSVTPIGFVVDVQVSRLTVNWCCQNMAVENFVSVPQPPTWLEGEDILALRRYKTSTRGLRTPETSFGVANVAVGEKVRFKDLEAGMKKYDGRTVEQGGLGKGKVHKVPRTETMGYDVNTFMVEGTTSWVDVQWQDLTISRHLSRDLTQYPNVDEHELWPGEIVIMKSDTGEDTSTNAPPIPQSIPRLNIDPNTVMGEADTEASVEIIEPKAVGVIQTVDAKERVAKIKWFEDPKMELAGTFMIPGSKTGKLSDQVEEVSFYEVVAHQALGVRRGDFVIVVPETHRDEPQQSSDSAGGTLNNFSNALQTFRQSAFLQNMANSPIVSFQSISNFFTSFQGNSAVAALPISRNSNSSSSVGPMDGPVDWFGEVVDLGLDGLVTVRLGALDEIRDVRVPLERLIVVSSEDADINGLDEDEEESSDEDYETDEDESGDEMSVWDNPDVIEERMFYEGGERIDNDGGDEAWLTDSDDDNMADHDMELEDAQGAVEYFSDITSATDGPPERGHHLITNAPPAEPYRPAPFSRQSTANQPAPEAFSIPDHAEKPPGFAVLDTPIPADHAYASTQPTVMDSAVLRRINKEHNILQTSLPEGILVRTWESRLDLLRVLIIGPLNTPYELAPFVFDFHLGPGFPNGPPTGYFHSWTGGVGRVNPNLYEEGKICLSLLGTWHAESSSEGWTVGSSILQLLVSLMGLVLVKEPYFNEAGFGIYVNTEEAILNSLLYSEKAYILARGFIKRVLTRPVAGFEDEIRWLYLPECESRGGLGLLRKVVAGMKEVVARSVARREGAESGQGENVLATEVIGAEGVGRVSAGALVLLRRHLTSLEGILEEKSGAASASASASAEA
ncbi:hypothetical protein DFH27DRAFT_98376 [Peziza echinospora]|nr:hypothetical protein DFH27DRAFT_98376 [Peziza echinospora]